MNETKRKYARFILKDCLKVKKDQPLMITGYTHVEDFMKLLEEEAKTMGLTDIYLKVEDKEKQRELLLSDEENLENHICFNRSIWEEYAKKDAAFAHIVSLIPHLMDDVNPKKLSKLNTKLQKQISLYRERQNKGEIPWCIFAVPNEPWAKELFHEENAFEKLWDTIFKICGIYEEDPGKFWDKKLEGIERKTNVLNEMQIEKLHYTNDLGTDLTIYLPEDYVWASAKDGEFIANMPTEEIFTSPQRDKTEGIVYSTKPLLYNGVFIDHFHLTFQEGKVVSIEAENGKEMLEEMIKMDENAPYLGECALVDYDSPISNSRIVFEETLLDENASCHLAIGESFSECIKNGKTMSKEELFEKGLNQSLIHVDFMVGDATMKIVATTKKGEEITIMEEGNLII